MTTKADLPTASQPTQLPEKIDYLGPAPLIQGDDAAAYDTLLAHASGTVKPADIFEEIWVRDIVDQTWESLRLRRHKAGLMNATADEGLRRVLWRFNIQGTSAITVAWSERDPETVQKVNELLASSGLTMDSVNAQTLRLIIDPIERIDRMIASNETRRNATLHEIERHRAGFGQKLRRAVEDVEDAEFEVIAPAAEQDAPAAQMESGVIVPTAAERPLVGHAALATDDAVPAAEPAALAPEHQILAPVDAALAPEETTPAEAHTVPAVDYAPAPEQMAEQAA